jgi:hypothetical protein
MNEFLRAITTQSLAAKTKAQSKYQEEISGDDDFK